MDPILVSVMKSVSDALRLDSENKLNVQGFGERFNIVFKGDPAIYSYKLLDNYNKEDFTITDAFIKYVECVLKIMTKLLQDVRSKGGYVSVTSDVMKYVRLGTQCMERISIVVNNIGTMKTMSPRSSSPSFSGSGRSRSEPCTPVTAQESPHCTPFSAPVPPISPDPNLSLYTRCKTLTPMEIAAKQNQQLIEAYKARSAKLTPRNACNLSLTIQRKMAENLALAKAQEDALSKKMLDRQKRLEELANQKFGISDLEHKQLYKKTMEYEQDFKWLQNIRQNMEENKDDMDIVCKSIQAVLRCKDHPLVEKLKTYQFKIYERLYPLVCDKERDLQHISVPLDKKFWPKPRKGDNGAENEELSHSNLDKCSEKESSSVTKEQEIDNDKTNKDLLKESEGKDSTDMKDICEEVKQDLESAIYKGDELKRKLESENKRVLQQAQRLSEEIDSYNVENMDDLFDDCDDDNNDDTFGEEAQSDKSCLPVDSTDSEDFVKSNLEKDDNTDVEKLKQEAYIRHIKGISDDIHCYLEKLISLFIVVYEQLDCADGREACYSQLEEPFFKPIWQYLLTLYRCANRQRELEIAHVMTVYKDSLPDKFGIIPKLRLQSPDHDVHSFPYKPAVLEILAITKQVTLFGKLECLVKSSRLICKCVEDFYGNADKVPNVGADDLLPIMGYVIVRTGLPQIVSECGILEEFIHEGYIMGEEGYCLTSVQTALKYLSTLSSKSSDL